MRDRANIGIGQKRTICGYPAGPVRPRDEQMRTFDSLPPIVRRALANAEINWGCGAKQGEAMLRYAEQHGAAALADYIAEQSADLASKLWAATYLGRR